MLTLGSYFTGLRGLRRQYQVAQAAGCDASVISLIEADSKVRFSTVKLVAKNGLKVKDDEWETIKLLWLQQISGEPIFSKTAYAAREKLVMREMSDTEKFCANVTASLVQNLDTITSKRLQPIILEVLSKPKLLAGLKSYREISRSLDPSPKSED